MFVRGFLIESHCYFNTEKALILLKTERIVESCFEGKYNPHNRLYKPLNENQFLVVFHYMIESYDKNS